MVDNGNDPAVFADGPKLDADGRMPKAVTGLELRGELCYNRP